MIIDIKNKANVGDILYYLKEITVHSCEVTRVIIDINFTKQGKEVNIKYILLENFTDVYNISDSKIGETHFLNKYDLLQKIEDQL